jgi:hypothetical protein
MMFSSNTCRFVACFLSLSLSAIAETVRGDQRELHRASYSAPTPSILATAFGDMETAYTNAAARPIDVDEMLDLGADTRGGDTLTHGGVYTFGTSLRAPTPLFLVSLTSLTATTPLWES